MRRQSGLADEAFSVILRCADFPRYVYPSLESIERQHLAPAEIVLVTDDTTPPAARPWIRQLARARGLLFVHVPRSSPGAVRNAGIAATTAAFIVALDSGELLDRRYFAQAFGRFVSEPSLDLVTSNVLMLGPGTQRRILEAGDCGLSGIVASPDAIHGAAIFRRRTWEAFGGFDESLPALDHYDFALKLAAAGRRCAVLDLPLLIRPVRRETLYRRAWERDRHVAAMDAIVRAHAEVFASDPASVLCAKERELQELGGHYRELVERRDRGVAELTSLESQAETARASVPSERASTIDVADFRRTTPVSRNWGFERGIPIDRYYIEGFLSRHAADIQGTVLEVQDPDYTHLFGAERVTRSDVVDLDPSNPRATVLSDLRAAANIPDETYNCIILTQTLHLIDDMPAVVAECARILAPGGVLLVTLPCASRVCVEYGIDGDFWRLTEAGARRLFSTAFPPEQLEVERSGNVLANAAFLYGLGRDELSAAELDANDPYFPLLITVRAVKSPRLAAIAGEDRPVGKWFSGRGKSAAAAAVLRYHRVAEPKDDLHGLGPLPL